MILHTSYKMQLPTESLRYGETGERLVFREAAHRG